MLPRHRLQLNVRNDHNSQFGTETTGSAAYGYQIDDAWRARLALSTGFKAPSFNDLYFPDDPALGGGNPNLKPESSFNREIGLNYEKGPASASLTLYRNEIEDLIQWAADDPSDDYSPWHPMNVSQARLEGLTLNGRYQWRDVTLRGFWLAKWFQKATPAEQMKVFGELTQLIASGKLKARIAATYSVAQIKEAVAAAASGERDGKILIVP